MSIQEHLNKIRNAIYGREVRESIAKGIETAYDDASEKDNANMEVKMARGTNPNLNTRLNKMDEVDKQTTAQLAQKTDKGNVSVGDINKNRGKFDETYMSDEFIAQFVDNTKPIHSFPARESLTTDRFAEKAVTPKKTDFIELVEVGTEDILLNDRFTLEGVIDVSTGEVASNSNFDFKTTERINITNAKHLFRYVGTGLYDAKYTDFQVGFYDVNDVFISGLSRTEDYTVSQYKGKYGRYYEVPSDAHYVRFSCQNRLLDGSSNVYRYLKVEKINQNKLKDDYNKQYLLNYIENHQTITSDQTDFIESVEVGTEDILLNDRFSLGGVLNVDNGELNPSSTFKTTDYVDIKNTKYFFRYTGNGGADLIYNDYQVVFYDMNKNYVSGSYSRTDYEMERHNGIYGRRYVIPEDAIYVRFSVNARHVDGSGVTYTYLQVEKVYKNQLKNSVISQPTTDRFRGINVLVTGDSITERNVRATKNWHDYLQEWFGFAEVFNDGKSGTGLVKGYSSHVGIINRVADWEESYGSNVDMILIMGNMNDGTNGELGDTLPGLAVGTFDDPAGNTSVYGALHKLFNDLISKYPDIPIGFISSTPRSQVGARGKCWGVDGWYMEYLEAQEKVCAHYSIPMLDLYTQSGLRPWNSANNKTYFSSEISLNGDGIHPNELGQEVMAQKIYEFVKQFM